MRLVGAEEARVQKEVSAVVNALADLTGLSSRWNGEVELSEETRIFGRKPFSCRIVLNQQLADNPIRWRTLIHEALHSFSAGYNPQDYQLWRGWEEGVVEQLQRLLRPSVLENINIHIDDAIFQEAEVDYVFNRYIGALEQLRQATGATSLRMFYLNLLSIGIKDRAGFVLSSRFQLQPEKQTAFIRLFSAANSVLKEFIV